MLSQGIFTRSLCCSGQNRYYHLHSPGRRGQGAFRGSGSSSDVMWMEAGFSILRACGSPSRRLRLCSPPCLQNSLSGDILNRAHCCREGHLSCPANQSCHINPANSQVLAPATARSPQLDQNPGFLTLKSACPHTPVHLPLARSILVERVILSLKAFIR